jgi:branched-chain amino acid transport system substrate-binding protein
MDRVRGIVVLVALLVAARTGAEPNPISVGDISSYSSFPAFTVPYRNGWQLALEEVNSSGGLLGGRKLQVISRDDAGKPDDATRHATELLSSEKVDVLAGAFLSNVGLALSDFALRNKILFVAAEPLTDALVWDKGNRYTFRLRPSTYMQSAMLVEEAAKLPARRWATVAPNYEYGQSAVNSFKMLLKAKRPDVEFVGEQWPALGKLEAGATIQALAAAKPEALFNVTFGADLTKFVREGNQRGLFEGRAVVSLLTGEPEYLDPLKDETPAGWIVTGYPWDQIHTPDHRKFVEESVQRLSARGFRGGLHDADGYRPSHQEGRQHGHRKTDRRVPRTRAAQPVRRDRVSGIGSPVYPRRLRGQAGTEGRSREDGGLALCRRQELCAPGCDGARKTAPGCSEIECGRRWS